MSPRRPVTIRGDMATETAAIEERENALVLAALCVASFLAALNFYAATPFYSRMSRDLDTTVPLLGQVATLIILVSAGLGLAVGPLSDRYGYRWPLVIGMFAIAVNLLGTGFAPSYPVLLVVGLAGGLGDALVFSLPLAIAGVRFAGQAQKRAIGWIIGSLSVAPIIGAPILTTIGGIAGWRTALVGAGVGAIGAAWFVASALPRDDRRPMVPFRWRELSTAYAPLLAHKPTLRLYCATALRAVTWIGLLTYLGAFLGDEVGLSTRQTGLVYTVGGIGFAIGSVSAGGRLRLGPPRVTVAVTCAIGAVAVGLLLLATTTWISVALLIVASVASAIAGVGIVTLLAAESPVGSGMTMVFNGSVLNLGAAGGTALGGGLIALGGYDALGWGLPIFSLLAALLAWWPAHDH
jgi:MFS transporter, DHA1 family, inner membrane transport protein